MPGLRVHDAPGRPGRRLQEPLADGGRRGGAGRSHRGQARDHRGVRDGPSAASPRRSTWGWCARRRRSTPRATARRSPTASTTSTTSRSRSAATTSCRASATPSSSTATTPRPRRAPRRGASAAAAGSSAPAAAACRSAAGAAARSWAPTRGCRSTSTWRRRSSTCTSARACGPNSITTNGNHSLHETRLRGRPRRVARPTCCAFAKYAVEHWGGQLEELIHTPLGYGIKNGQQVPLAFWGAATNADHFDHVHLADTDPPDAKDQLDGGPAQPGSGAGGGGERRPRRRLAAAAWAASAGSASRSTSCAGTARAAACPTSPALPTTSPRTCARSSTTS